MATVLVGIDDSERGEAAQRWAARHAQLTGGEVLAVRVVSTGREALLDLFPTGPQTWKQQVSDLVDGPWTAALQSSGVPFTTHVEEGDPARKLAELAAAQQVDLLVVGTPGHGRVLGGVAYALAHHATTPLVLVPAPSATTDAPP